VARWLKKNKVTKADPDSGGIGISLDEIGRANYNSQIPYIVKEFPLLDLKLRRRDCEEIIKSAGLPVPPKSACWFCPFKSLNEWKKMSQEFPHLFKKSVELEAILNEKRDMLGKDHVYLTGSGKPLDYTINNNTPLLTMMDEEESFSCSPFACTGGV